MSKATVKCKGTVKWFDPKKGYGFLLDSEGKDVFVHYTDIIMEGFRYFNEGDIVNYHIVVGKDGRERAINVKPILTHSMIVHELAKEKLHILRIVDNRAEHGWYVVDEANQPVVDKKMDLLGLAAYAGFDVEGLLE